MQFRKKYEEDVWKILRKNMTLLKATNVTAFFKSQSYKGKQYFRTEVNPNKFRRSASLT